MDRTDQANSTRPQLINKEGSRSEIWHYFATERMRPRLISRDPRTEAATPGPPAITDTIMHRR